MNALTSAPNLMAWERKLSVKTGPQVSPVDGFIDVTPHVRLKPFGRSPAVSIDVVVKCVIDSMPPPLPAPSDDDVRLAFLTAGDDAFVYCRGHLLDDGANHIISITGLIIYHDYAKNEYRPPFCYYYSYDPRAKEAFEKKRVGGCPLRADFK
ncbi:hypothetical protein RBB77_14215 [Tunturibacter psychrotolerans]|uniref:Uncharacterized protein n=1 Tax=Tunturiibacter psychrotolerans TaxID=3069686 RepID=A0AAU7ZL56_9BACT